MPVGSSELRRPTRIERRPNAASALHAATIGPLGVPSTTPSRSESNEHISSNSASCACGRDTLLAIRLAEHRSTLVGTALAANIIERSARRTATGTRQRRRRRGRPRSTHNTAHNLNVHRVKRSRHNPYGRVQLLRIRRGQERDDQRHRRSKAVLLAQDVEPTTEEPPLLDTHISDRAWPRMQLRLHLRNRPTGR